MGLGCDWRKTFLWSATKFLNSHIIIPPRRISQCIQGTRPVKKWTLEIGIWKFDITPYCILQMCSRLAEVKQRWYCFRWKYLPSYLPVSRWYLRHQVWGRYSYFCFLLCLENAVFVVQIFCSISSIPHLLHPSVLIYHHEYSVFISKLLNFFIWCIMFWIICKKLM